jgi:hypothetical protein
LNFQSIRWCIYIIYRYLKNNSRISFFFFENILWIVKNKITEYWNTFSESESGIIFYVYCIYVLQCFYTFFFQVQKWQKIIKDSHEDLWQQQNKNVSMTLLKFNKVSVAKKKGHRQKICEFGKYLELSMKIFFQKRPPKRTNFLYLYTFEILQWIGHEIKNQQKGLK